MSDAFPQDRMPAIRRTMMPRDTEALVTMVAVDDDFRPVAILDRPSDRIA